ncbi:MAG TPA: SCP2 domain-containing protein [Acidiferrobacteraceae bacterium]|nr:SCP2 domain-containing protein [Acidiferrobacteraceae bacterium]
MNLASIPVPLKTALGEKLPLLLARNIARAPFALQRGVLEKVLHYVLKEALRDGELDFLQGQYIKITLEDAHLCWYFGIQGQRIVLKQRAQESASIRGNLREFMQLATRCEDPDTLFFQRRLMIEGDTEIGLQVKNLLDTLDLDTLPLPLRKGLELAARLVCRPN